MSTTKVTGVTIQSTGDGLRAEVQITRASLPSSTPAPSPSDVPEDIRQALRVWLAGNQP